MCQLPNFVFDVDSTLLSVESLEVLASHALKDRPDRTERLAAIDAMTQKAMAGELSIGEALFERVKLVPAPRTLVTAVAEELKSALTPSIADHRNFFAKHRDRIWAITNGFREVLSPALIELGMHSDHIFANAFLFDDQDCICGLDRELPLASEGGKARVLRSLELAGPVAILGDGATDAGMKAGHDQAEFCVFTENARRPAVVAMADREARNFSEFLSPYSLG